MNLSAACGVQRAMGFETLRRGQRRRRQESTWLEQRGLPTEQRASRWLTEMDSAGPVLPDHQIVM